MQGEKLLKLKPGTTVEVLEVEGFNVLVSSEGKTGWIHKNRINVIK